MTSAEEVPEHERVYLCEIDIMDLATGVGRRVPLSFFQRIAIPTTSRRGRRGGKSAATTDTTSAGAQPDHPSRSEVIRFVDGDVALEASTWEEFRARLRDQYPDDRFERRLHVQRDREAEVRREQAIHGLIQLIAEGIADDLLKEQSAALSAGSGN